VLNQILRSYGLKLLVNGQLNNGNGSIFIAADSAESYANGAFAKANNEGGVNATQNTNITNAGTYANSAFLAANTPSHVANSAASYANSAFSTANFAFSAANTADAKAVTAGSYANSAFAVANNGVGIDATQNMLTLLMLVHMLILVLP
jgi:hypothetical protein